MSASEVIVLDGDDGASPISSDPTEHCTKLEKLSNGYRFQCNYCEQQWTGSGTRCYAHFTGETGVKQCLSVPENVVKTLTEC